VEEEEEADLTMVGAEGNNSSSSNKAVEDLGAGGETKEVLEAILLAVLATPWAEELHSMATNQRKTLPATATHFLVDKDQGVVATETDFLVDKGQGEVVIMVVVTIFSKVEGITTNFKDVVVVEDSTTEIRAFKDKVSPSIIIQVAGAEEAIHSRKPPSPKGWFRALELSKVLDISPSQVHLPKPPIHLLSKISFKAEGLHPSSNRCSHNKRFRISNSSNRFPQAGFNKINQASKIKRFTRLHTKFLHFKVKDHKPSSKIQPLECLNYLLWTQVILRPLISSKFLAGQVAPVVKQIAKGNSPRKLQLPKKKRKPHRKSRWSQEQKPSS
jgi:hypothetical protein